MRLKTDSSISLCCASPSCVHSLWVSSNMPSEIGIRSVAHLEAWTQPQLCARSNSTVLFLQGTCMIAMLHDMNTSLCLCRSSQQGPDQLQTPLQVGACWLAPSGCDVAIGHPKQAVGVVILITALV